MNTLRVFEREKLVGKADVVVTQAYELEANSRDFAESLTAEVTSASGRAVGSTLTLSASCGGTCKATEKFPKTALRKGEEAATTIMYHDTTASQNVTRTSYALTARKGPLSTVSPWKSPSYRCDQQVGRSAGCVFHKVKPVLTAMGSLPEISRNIRRIQDAGPHHYGDRTRGNPLTRTTSATVERANRNRSCPASRKRPQGMSCDEYPFARSNQGASRVARKDWGWAWVPTGEQNRQGGLLSAFYKSNRVLNNDAYWVEVPR